MSYDVIARKWRPVTFSDVIGQEPIVRTLTNAIRSGRIHHSFIFAGLRGTGKTSTARILAKALNCIEGPTSEPCGKCVACDEITRGVDVDVFEIDAASNKGVDDIRDLKEIVQFPPTRDRYKVFIIDEAHMLSQHAFNALLKTIEEPPGYVVFILATTEAHKIPTTIRSRCQLFEFRRIPNRLIREQLEKIVESEQVQVEGDAISLITDAAEGSMRDAQSLLDQIISFSGDAIREEDVAYVLGIPHSRVFFELLRCIQLSDPAGIVDLMDDLESRNTDFVKLAIRFADFLQQALRAQLKQAGDFFPEDWQDVPLSAEDFMRHLNILVQQERSIRDAVNKRIGLELILLKMCYSRHVIPVAQLLGKKKSLNEDRKPVPAMPSSSRAAPSTPASHGDTVPVDPAAVVAEVRDAFPQLGPFLKRAELSGSGDDIRLAFTGPVPGIIREELETEFREALARRLAKELGRPVSVTLVFPEAETGGDSRQTVREHPLVEQVVSLFDGEIEAITNKENNDG